MVFKKINTIIKNLSIFHQDSRQDAFRASQELARPHLSQPQRYERVKSFERLSLQKRAPQLPAHRGFPREMLPQVQSRPSEATTVSKVSQFLL
jgi:hypothetical protein